MTTNTRLKRVALLVGGGTPPVDRSEFWDGAEGVPWVSIGDMSDGLPVTVTARRIAPEGIALKRLTVGQPGTVLFAMYASIGAVAELAVHATWNQALVGILPRNAFADGRFIRYWLQHIRPTLLALARSSTQNNLNAEQVGNLPFPNFSLCVQQAIVCYLDAETARIDTLIDKQKKLIELLKEKRQAVISQAVTKGLDRDVLLKDSGVEWLGEVPAHWDVVSVRLVFNLGRGRVISHEDISNNIGPYPVYSSQTERDGELGRISSFDFSGDYLTWTTDGAHAGRVFRRCGKFSCTNVCGTMKPSTSRIFLDFAKYAVGLATAAFVRHDINPKLMNNVMAGIIIPLPAKREQEEIAELIRAEKTRSRAMEAKVQHAILLLRERRAAIITAAVTGQIDVSNYTNSSEPAAA